MALWRWSTAAAVLCGVLIWNESVRDRLQHENSRLKQMLRASCSLDADVCYEVGREATGEEQGQAEEDYGFSVAVMVHTAMFAMFLAGFSKFLHEEVKLAKHNATIQRKLDQEKAESTKSKTVSRSLLRFTFKEFVFYRMDFLLSNWSAAKPMALLMATYVLIMTGAILYYLFGESSDSFTESVWRSWTFVADPGTHSEEVGLLSRFVALLLTIGGMLIFALVIGIIADGVSDLLDDLKKGRSRVIESNHTLILGWSDKVIPTVRELALANMSESGGVVVLLADRPKEEMETDLNNELGTAQLYGTEVICRSGSPLNMSDLIKVSAQTSKAVIVLSDPTADADESDARAVRIVMSLKGLDTSCHIVVEMCDIDNRELVMLVGGGKVETVVAHDIIGRLMVQCARQPGLAQILEQLLGFAGDEFYIKEWPELVGLTFRDASFRFDQAVPIGIKPADRDLAARQLREATDYVRSKLSMDTNELAAFDLGPQNRETGYADKKGQGPRKPRLRRLNTASSHLSVSSTFCSVVSSVILNPPDSYVLQPGDKVVVIAEDDDSYEASADMPPSDAAQRACLSVTSQHPVPPPEGPEKVLFCGYRRDVDDLISTLDHLVHPGSELHLMCTIPINERLRRIQDGNKVDMNRLMNLKIVHHIGNPVLRRHLEKLVLEDFSSILILADEAFERNMQTADSRSLASLLLIRDIVGKRTVPIDGENESYSPVIRALTSFKDLNMEPELQEALPEPEDLDEVPSPEQDQSESENKGQDNENNGTNKNKNMAFSDHDEDGDASEEEDKREDVEPSPSQSGTTKEKHGTHTLHKNSGGMSANTVQDSISLKLKPFADMPEQLLQNATGELEKMLPAMPPPRLFRQTSDTQRSQISRSWCPTNHKSEHEERKTIIISEILDSRTKSLISVARVSDYVMSNEIIACALAMVAEDRSINTVLKELLSASGSEIQVRSCLEYCEAGESLDFWTLMARARKCREIAIGYKVSSKDGSPGAACLNPRNKSEIRRWERGDFLVVLTNR